MASVLDALWVLSIRFLARERVGRVAATRRAYANIPPLILIAFV